MLVLLPFVLFGARSLGQGFTPTDAAARMKLPEGLSVQIVASEPEIRQPILVKYDDRGRLWVIQYLQYPNPAGLKRVQVDRWSRTTYDRIPEPPPRGPKGTDRITICEDFDAHGRARRYHDFVGRLNLATGLEFGHGGVYVLQAPYLLFYPDRNRDDIPDGEPEILLAGFGMEDAQSLANHLTWGPDGWLYGLNGSTTTCRIRGLEFQQGVWRYHPLSKEFELFCEGGGNLFGLTFDAKGNLFYSSNGNFLFFHAIQGGYYAKNYGKHGPLHNPYTYGTLRELTKDVANVHGPSTGGTIYLGDSFPERFHGAFICGDFLGHSCSWWTVRQRGATLTAKFGGKLVDARDTWCCPTDLCLAPDGSIVWCDFYDKRTAHPDPDADWDRSNGRVYRIVASDSEPSRSFDLPKLNSTQVLELLKHRNGWFRDRARHTLAQRRDPSVWAQLRAWALQESEPELALQSLWALNVSGGFDDAIANRLLTHPDEYVRSWSIRLLGDRKQVSATIAKQFEHLAASDASVVVLAQLAASSRRLPASQALPIVFHLLGRNLDDDPNLPWLLWWAVESKAISDRNAVLKQLADRDWQANKRLFTIAEHLTRRWGAQGESKTYDACAALLSLAQRPVRVSLLRALSQGLSERSATAQGVGPGDLFRASGWLSEKPSAVPRHFEPVSPRLSELIRTEWREQPQDSLCIRIALQSGVEEAYPQLLKLVSDCNGGPALLASALRILLDHGKPDACPLLLPLLDQSLPLETRSLALDVLQRLGHDGISAPILERYSRLPLVLQSKARDVLFSRPKTARAFLDQVDAGKIAAADVPIDQLRRIALHNDKDLDARVRRHWGNIQPGTPEEKLATMRRLGNDLRAGAGDPLRGKLLFHEQCGKCHKLHGEGASVGPDLTAFSRRDTEALLASIVDPSAIIKAQYISYVVTLKNGVALTGLIAEQDPASITLLDAKNERTRLPRSQIEEMHDTPVSLMPEDQWKAWTPQQLRDLFAYLQK